MLFRSLLRVFLGLLAAIETARGAKDYYYTRTRQDPNHLRVSEEFKNKYIDEIKHESNINGTRYEYYKSSLNMNYDELVFETIDKMFQHRLSPFYVHHYDNQIDKRRAADPALVSNKACARDLMYLVDKLPKRPHQQRDPLTNNDEDHLTPELTAFFDSYGRQEAGLMMGNIYWVGAYDQCVNRHIFELLSSQPPDLRHRPPADDDQVVSFKGRYCVSALKSPTWDAIVRNKKIQGRNYFKSQRQLEDYAKLFRLQVGICLPSSCDSTALERHPEEMKLLTTSGLERRFDDYELIDLYCLPDESSPLRAWSGSALYFLIFLAFWLTLILLATMIEVSELLESPELTRARGKKATRWQLVVVAFSLRANYRKLMRVTCDESSTESEKRPTTSTGSLASKAPKSTSPQPSDAVAAPEKVADRKQLASTSAPMATTTTQARPSSANKPGQVAKIESDKTHAPSELKVNLRFLNALKVLIMFWIVNGHIMLLMIQTAKNILYSDALLNGLMHFLIGATFGVDLFFTMTGFLTAYLIFNSGHAFRLRPATVLYLTFHRYWRLAPMYLLSFWFSRSVAQLLGSGPLWDYGTTSLTFRGLCNHESWWYPATLTSNLHGLFEECMITSWYISCDMQFWLISPIFIHLLAKSPLAGWAVSVLTIALSSKVRYDSILVDQSARYDELVQPRADIFMRVSHDLPALYTHPHYRVGAYVVGLLAGHYVYMVKSGRWSAGLLVPPMASKSLPARRRQALAYFGLLAFGVMSFVSYLLANYYPSSMLRHARTVAALAYSVNHLIMSLGASLALVTMCFGQWPSVVSFLSHPIWTRLSKINYSLLLLQCEAIYFQIFRYDQVPVAGTKELINILFNLLVTLYPLAFVVTLAFEFPLANMEKLL